MAWSDAARKAALLVRQLRKGAKVNQESKYHYHTCNIGGKIHDVTRKGLANRIRRMRRGEIAPDARILGVSRVSQHFQNKKRSAIISVNRAYQFTDRATGKKR